jgi:hypothetical protein
MKESNWKTLLEACKLVGKEKVYKLLEKEHYATENLPLIIGLTPKHIIKHDYYSRR